MRVFTDEIINDILFETTVIIYDMMLNAECISYFFASVIAVEPPSSRESSLKVIVTPNISNPCFKSKAAVKELSTPPLIATAIFLFFFNGSTSFLIHTNLLRFIQY